MHTEKLISEYERLINDKNRPNSALEAKANYVFVKLLLGQDANVLFEELSSIITESQGVLDFSLDTISKIIMELAPQVEESNSFDKLFETIVAMTNNRKQEITQDSEMEVKIHFAVFLCGYRIIFYMAILT